MMDCFNDVNARFTKLIAKFCSKGPFLSKDMSPQKFHKVNFKVSQQRPVLVIGHVTANVSQSQLPVAKFRIKGLFLS